MRREDDSDAHQVRWKGWPGHDADLWDLASEIRFDLHGLPLGYEYVVPANLPVHAEPAKDQANHFEVFWRSVFNQDLTLCNCGCADEADHLQVVRTDGELTAVEFSHAHDVECVRPDIFNLGAQVIKKVAEILNVRLGGCVLDDGLARRSCGGHDGVFGRRHAGFIEQNFSSLESIRGFKVHVSVGVTHLHSQCFQRKQVSIDPTSTDHVSTRRRKIQPTDPSQHRTREQDRGTNPSAEIGIDVPVSEFLGVNLPGMYVENLYRYAQAFHEHFHSLDVADIRHVMENDRFGGE